MDLCEFCEEELLEGENFGKRCHRECLIRAVAGSVGHQMGLCSCNGGPDILHDPPGLSKRDAARAAMFVCRELAREAARQRRERSN